MLIKNTQNIKKSRDTEPKHDQNIIITTEASKKRKMYMYNLS